MSSPSLLPLESITHRILLLRGQKVLLDADLAMLYGVETRRLNEQVRRNRDRFPEGFIFRLTVEEIEALNLSQFATGSQKHRDPRFPPFAFTEHGAIMAATVLKSQRAAEVSVYVVRAFVALRELLTSNKELALKLSELESRIERKLDSHDQAIAALINAMRELMRPPEPQKKRPIGFITGDEKPKKDG